ncbi:MAG: ABC transporter permease [Acidobacteria bacterium]|nr:ABC transporter permease [Acidobacteriota bacterium]
MFAALAQDLRHALRHLQRSSAFVTCAVVTLALGIGATTAMLTLFNAIVLRPLAIADPHGLIGISGRGPQDQLRPTPVAVVPHLEPSPLGLVCAYNGGAPLAVEVAGTPAQAVGVLMTERCLAAFGVAPILGRVFTADEAPVGKPGRHVALIGHAFWTRMFGANPDVLGTTLRAEGVTFSIIGVLPPGFGGLHADFGGDVFAPFDTIFASTPARPSSASHILGRLRPGVSLAQATAQVEAQWPTALEAATPTTLPPPMRAMMQDAHPRVERIGSGTSFYRSQYGRPLTMVVVLTAVLLLLACINLGGLLLSRLAARESELAIRKALGGSRWRIGQQVVVESLLLSLGGTLLAIPVASAVVAVFATYLPAATFPRAVAFTPDPMVFAATALVGVLTGLLISVLPVRIANGSREVVQSTGDRTIASATSRWARGLLVSQVALSFVLLADAGLLVRSFAMLQRVDLGLRMDHVLSIQALPVPDGYANIDNASYYPALWERLVAVPGVRSVGFSKMFPRLSFDMPTEPVAFAGEPESGAGGVMETVSPGFFEAVGIPLLRGRLLTWADDADAPHVGLVSESLERALVDGGDVVGRRIRLGQMPINQDVVIVGIVRNATLGNPRQADIPVLYRPALQAGGRYPNSPNIAIAIDGDVASVVAGVRRVFRDAGREYPHRIEPLADALAEAPASERMSATLAAAMGGLAVLLAAIGLYGLLAYAVVRRTREIGVRMAVGADPRSVIRMVIGEGLLITLAGVAIGLPLALVAARALRTLMFGIAEFDLTTFAVTMAIFAAVGLAAGFVPARRAARLDPTVALRAE